MCLFSPDGLQIFINLRTYKICHTNIGSTSVSLPYKIVYSTYEKECVEFYSNRRLYAILYFRAFC